MAQRGGRRGPLNDDKEGRDLTWIILIFAVFLGLMALLYYDVSWGGFGPWMQDNWYWLLGGLVILLLAWRAYQGVTSGDSVRDVSLGTGGRGGGGGDGGGSSRWMILLYGILIVVILWIILLILQQLNVLSGRLEDWVGSLNPFHWFDYIGACWGW